MRLANRRFISVFFDLDNSGAAGDPDARKFVVAARKELGGKSVSPPPVLFMNVKGEVLGEVSNFATADEVLAAMLAVLKKHPEYNEQSADEKNAKSVIERAQIAIDLQQLQQAKEILAKEDSSQVHYLLGRLARFQEDWKGMEDQFVKVGEKEFQDDLTMERAYPLWYQQEFAKLRDHLKDFPKASKRYTEARYFEGLAWYHLGEKPKALAIWKDTIKACAQDPWIYRADWAYTESVGQRSLSFSTADQRASLLNRIGYLAPLMGNPDLVKPTR